MKKIILAACLLLILVTSSYGQWYVKKYNVTDIDSLSKEQLEESLVKSKEDQRLAFAVALVGGGAMALIGVYTLYIGFGDNPSWFEELVGNEFMGHTYLIIGAGILAGGTIAYLVYLGRTGRIKSVIKKNFPSTGSLNISPAIILNSCTRSYCPGFTLTYNF